jgi:oligopeptide/dipeptide ABC transporter ATP-binding protein
MSAPILSVIDLRTSFEDAGGVARAVDGISFEVREGETLGLVGESGCGKTVTALSVLGLLPDSARIEEGSSIRLRDEELVGLSGERLRGIRGNDVAMIFQEPVTSLNPVQKVGDQIAEALRLHRGMGAREALAGACGLLEEMELADAGQLLEAYPHQLSGGMCQRVMIAMALACEPALLIADEPTTALDVTTQSEILQLLAGLRDRRRMSVLLITHDLGVVAEVCDRVVVMYAGQIVESGSVEEVFADPQHPYTRGLLACLPDVDRPGRRLSPIDGAVPRPTAWPYGCRFRPRCSDAFDQCHEEPALVSLDSSDRNSRCWMMVDEGGRGARDHGGPA